MVIVFEQGARFWIEQHSVSLTIPDAAGRTDSAVINVDRPGNCVGHTVTAGIAASNDNSQAIALLSLLDPGSGSIANGEFITGVIARITKAAGTAGNTVVVLNITLLMRGSGS